MKKILWVILFFPLFTLAQQSSHQPDAARIKLRLKKLNFLGSVLYVAAHPDDENTRIITWLSNDRLATTAYLSLTRGDGGQNLIGPEIGEQLGVIRTQELLAARRIDGGQQFFTRAIDFGFSKSAEEAFSIWGEKEEILSDVVKIYRQYQPDVIITRFPADARAGHGHHTASAVLAGEAFDASAKPGIFPEQVKKYGTWQAKRLYTNTGRWWNRDINENTPDVISIDVGGYNSLLGKSYTEISASSSSQHKSQGWGRRGERGYQPEFLEYRKGKKAGKDIFDDINTRWSRVAGGEKIQPLVDKVISEFDEENPAASVPVLFQIRKAIGLLDDGVWKNRKLAETEQLIQDCLGLYVEVTASHHQAVPGQRVDISIEVVNRSAVSLKLAAVASSALQWDSAFTAVLERNRVVQVKTSPVLPSSAPYSLPYWLEHQHGQGMYNVKDETKTGLPENIPAVEFTFNVVVDKAELTFKKPVIYKWVDPVKGELWRPFEIVPPLFIDPATPVMIFNDTLPKSLSVKLRSCTESPTQGTLKLGLPEGWRSKPSSIDFQLTNRDEEQIKSFSVYPSSNESKGTVSAVAEVGGKNIGRSLQLISYDHIPIQTLMPPANVTVAKMTLKKSGDRIGYIRGAGDEIPAALRIMGYDVWEMTDEEVTPANLARVDAVVLGVRAFNTNKHIRHFMDELLHYVYNGGTLVVQYNISFDFGKQKFSPYPLKVSRDRVAEEASEVKILKPTHEVMNTPNKITAIDFEGWVQERGLYFPDTWDKNFDAILSMNDKGETAKEGSLLIAKHGKGYYVYTGLSFFRQLPAGVSGAYKLFANIVSLGHGQQTAHKQRISR